MRCGVHSTLNRNSKKQNKTGILNLSLYPFTFLPCEIYIMIKKSSTTFFLSEGYCFDHLLSYTVMQLCKFVVFLFLSSSPAVTFLAVILLAMSTASFLFSFVSGLPGSKRTNKLLRIKYFIIDWATASDSEKARWCHFKLSKSFINFSPAVFKAEIVFWLL